ncbi:WD repeat-containing protein [Paramyrothecium foliicola]|nr:WD repeat-containing protein [Paramyrothecium foliicola]
MSVQAAAFLDRRVQSTDDLLLPQYSLITFHGPSTTSPPSALLTASSSDPTAARRRGEADVDRSTSSRSRPVETSDNPLAPNQQASASSSSTTSSTDPPPGNPESTGADTEAIAAPANIEPSTASTSESAAQAPVQVLGRRRRASSSSQHQQEATSAPPEASSSLIEPNPKRRRADISTMLADTDVESSHNGTGAAGRSNGSTSPPVQRPAASGVTNGTHKPGAFTNGSSNGNKPPATAGQQPSTYFGHDREEVTRILIQALTDMGYRDAAESISRDSGYDLESPTVAAFRSAVLAGSWAEAEELLVGAATSEAHGGEGNGLVLAPGSDRNVMRFWLRQQKFLELLEQRNTPGALTVLRGDLTPLYHDTSRLHFLSSLLMCRTAEDLKAKADWDGAQGDSRRVLLSELSKCISPSVMLPENRLAVLLQQVKQSQIDTCLYHTAASSPSLYCDHLCDRRYFPTELALELIDLAGEVWQVQFSHDGTRLAACGSKEVVVIWDTSTYGCVAVLGGHDGGVGNVAWSPDDSMLVTCSQDKHARLWDAKASSCDTSGPRKSADRIQNGTLIKKLKRFEEPVIGCVWASDSRSFVVGSLDRSNSLCTFNVYNDEMHEWGKKHRVQDLCGSLNGRWLVAVNDQQTVHIYNANTRELEYDMELKARPMSVAISDDSRHLLVNKRDGEAQLIDLISKQSVQKFLGHTGGEYLIRSAFGGANESFVISGSEDGNILIWHKNIGAAVERLAGHEPRCNAVSWNPADPCMLASCGDDGVVKIWSNKAGSIDLKSRYQRSSNGWTNSNEDI